MSSFPNDPVLIGRRQDGETVSCAWAPIWWGALALLAIISELRRRCDGPILWWRKQYSGSQLSDRVLLRPRC